MVDIGLIVEGGGMRGVYTAGVLDYFMERNLYFDDCYAVSAGACHVCSYLSKQKGRSIKVVLDYINDKRYCSVSSLIKTGDMFGAKMLYDTIPNELELYDYNEFDKFKGNFYSVVTNCESGKAEYMNVKDMKRDIIAVRASSSLPLISRIVDIDGGKYLDGGLADSIPLKKSIEDGHKKNVVILTRDKEYKKKESRFLSIFKFKYKKYPNLIDSIENRHKMYNETLDYIDEKEKQGEVFVIRPKHTVTIGRLEKDKEKLKVLYDEGYNDAKEQYEELMKFINEK